MSAVAITGSQVLNNPAVVEWALAQARMPTRVVHGGCVGVDEFVSRWLAQHHPEVSQMVFRPVAPRASAEKAMAHRYPVTMAIGDELARNRRMLTEADELWAFPRTGRESLRSGTWATVREARKRGMFVRGFPLNGDPPWVE